MSHLRLIGRNRGDCNATKVSVAYPLFMVFDSGSIGLGYAWAFTALALIVHAGRTWTRDVVPEIEQHPEKKVRYFQLIGAWLGVLGLFLFVGSLHMRGIYPPNPLATAALGALALSLVYLTWWLTRGGGAEELEAHPGLPLVPQRSAETLKKAWVLFLLGVASMVTLTFVLAPPADLAKEISRFMPLVGPALFALAFFLISSLLAHLSGWSAMAKLFPATGRFRGKWRLMSAQMGDVRHKGTLRCGVDDFGIHLASVLPFRIGHPPLSIPWHAIKVTPSRGRIVVKVTMTPPVIIVVRKHDLLRALGPMATPQALEFLRA